MNPLQKLADEGQSPWLDYIDRTLLDGGKLERLIRDDGLKGVTSNPSIFAKAIGSSNDYDDDLRAWLADNADATDKEAYEALAVREIQRACDILRKVYDTTGRDDGFVSLEVSPALAADTAATIDEARRLWHAVDRPNLMIKVPATPEGIPAIEALIGEGININVTLIFSQAHYDVVARAYLRGLARLAADNPARLAEVDSVASVFVSRVDTLVDERLGKIGTPQALALRGNVAIANCKMIYQRYRDLFGGDAFADLQRRGARPQRVLWGSTSTKNPAYRDVIYAEALIGPETVNTLPPQTLEAFRDHGRVAPELVRGIAEAAGHLAELAIQGIDLYDVCEELQRAGVKSFADAFDGLLESLASKRAALAAK
jgi:transaldolase